MCDESKGSTFRTIPKAAEYMRAKDPDCAITENAIRQAVRENKIPCRKVGVKSIVSIEEVGRYFEGAFSTTPEDDDRDDRKMGEFF